MEEVVVPVIELTLKDSSISVRLVEEAVIVDVRNGAEITLFFNSPVHDVSVVFKMIEKLRNCFDEMVVYKDLKKSNFFLH